MYDRIIIATTKALWDTELIASRIILAAAELFWAVMLLWPGVTFTSEIYKHMSSVMSEDFWGILFLFSAIIQINIVISNKLHSLFSRYFAGLNMCLWGYVVISMVISVYPPPAAIGGEIALMVSAFWIWIRPYILIKGYKRAAQ